MSKQYRIVERIDHRTARIYYAIQVKFLWFWFTEYHYGIWATAEAAEDMVMKLTKNPNRVVKTFSYNNMSDTTESDKAKIAFTSLFANDDAYWVPFKVSCKLECERDEAKAEIKKLKEELEWQAWTTSPEIAQAKIDELVEQRDRLAEALQDVMKYRKGEEPYDCWRLPESHRRNVQFDGWNEIENRINAALAAVKG